MSVLRGTRKGDFLSRKSPLDPQRTCWNNKNFQILICRWVHTFFVVGTVRPIPLRYMTVRPKHSGIYIIFNSYIITKNGPSRTPVPTICVVRLYRTPRQIPIYNPTTQRILYYKHKLFSRLMRRFLFPACLLYPSRNRDRILRRIQHPLPLSALWTQQTLLRRSWLCGGR